jgi:hypothetical protein
MRTCLAISLFFLLPMSVAAQSKSAKSPMVLAPIPTATPLPLKDGTPIHLRLTQTISSADAHTGDPVHLEVTDEITLANRVVIAKGAPAVGTVLMPESKKVKGHVDINIVEVTLLDGSKASLRAKEAAANSGHTLEFFPPSPPYPYMNGKDQVLPKELMVTAFVDGALNLDSTKFPLSLADPTQATPHQPQVATEVDVISSPSGAEIEVDGAFVADTPSAIAVPAGDHTILVRMAGYDPWKQMFRAQGTKLAFSAQLTNTGANGDTMSCWGGTDCVSSSVGIAPVVKTKPVSQKKRQTSDNDQ